VDVAATSAGGYDYGLVLEGFELRRLALAVPIILGTLAVSGCGGASFTLKTSVLTFVVSGDPDIIADEKAGMPGGRTTDGDTHTGNKICETDVDEAGRNFHVVVYATTALPSSICNTLKTGING